MTSRTPPQRTRLVLVSPDGPPDVVRDRLERALAGGDVASVIVPQHGRGDGEFQALAEAIVPMIQEAGAAVLLEDDTRTAGRVGADGVHLESALFDLQETVEKSAGRFIVGAGGARTRHEALELGEMKPDYVFFGRLGGDTFAEVHPKMLELGEWWAEIIEIPCIVLGGNEIGSVVEAAAAGIEFVALGAAVFAEGVDPREAVATANARLDDVAADAVGTGAE